MKPFEQWVMDPVTPVHQLPALPEGLWQDKKGDLLALCVVCGCPYHYWGDIPAADDFDPAMSYCGKSDRCIP